MINVSVVIPSYNMGQFIEGAIDSILRCQDVSVEAIVVDDGSQDETKAVVSRYSEMGGESYSERVKYIRQPNSGKASAVNRGIRASQGSHVMVMDADDELIPEGLWSLFQARRGENGEAYDLVVGGFEVFDNGEVYGMRPAPRTGDPQRLRSMFSFGWKTPFHLNACLISKDLIKRAGFMDEQLRRCEDIDYSMRLLRTAKLVNTVPKVVYRYRKHRSSAINRVRYRLKTLRERPIVLWQNYEGFRRWASIPYGICLDVGKLVYEIFENYKK